MQKDLVKMIENFSKMGTAAVDSCARFNEITAKNRERLVKQQLEMMQLTGWSSSDQIESISEITETVCRYGERLTKQQLDMMKLSIEDSAEFIKESGDVNDIKSALDAQKGFAEEIGSLVMNNAQSGLDLTMETQKEIKSKMKNFGRKRRTQQTKSGAQVRTKKSRKISGSLAERAKSVTKKDTDE
ncbi:MAG: phasin family protein [Gammaproteobacteria bacterium]|nr:MAG: phasin family protein [Gammaproteobacteria bacterium]